jgi:hypothetical protein
MRRLRWPRCLFGPSRVLGRARREGEPAPLVPPSALPRGPHGSRRRAVRGSGRRACPSGSAVCASAGVPRIGPHAPSPACPCRSRCTLSLRRPPLGAEGRAWAGGAGAHASAATAHMRRLIGSASEMKRTVSPRHMNDSIRIKRREMENMKKCLNERKHIFHLC